MHGTACGGDVSTVTRFVQLLKGEKPSGSWLLEVCRNSVYEFGCAIRPDERQLLQGGRRDQLWIVLLHLAIQVLSALLVAGIVVSDNNPPT